MPSPRSLPGAAQITRLLKKTLPPAHLALLHLVAGEAAAQDLPLYIIGGFVRDLFIGQPGLDFDLVLVGDAVAFSRRISRKFGGRVTIHPKFGTATWEPDLAKLESAQVLHARSHQFHPLDLITARSEVYPSPGELPVVKPGSLEEDLRRRDFTINTLALRLDGDHFGQLVDLLGGLADIEKGVVRALHPESYLDDPTRILRAVRYEQRYGFLIATEDLRLIAGAVHGIAGLSGERLRHELDLVLLEQKTAAMLARLDELGVFKQVQPPLPWDGPLLGWLQKLGQPVPPGFEDIPDLLHIPRRMGLGYLLWLGGLPGQDIIDLAARLDFTAGLREALLAFSDLLEVLPSLLTAKPSVVVEKLEDTPLLVVYAAWIRQAGPEKQVLESYLARWRRIHSKTKGDDLIRLGMEPGPIFSEILWSLRAAWIDGLVGSAAEEQALLQELIQKEGRKGLIHGKNER